MAEILEVMGSVPEGERIAFKTKWTKAQLADKRLQELQQKFLQLDSEATDMDIEVERLLRQIEEAIDQLDLLNAKYARLMNEREVAASKFMTRRREIFAENVTGTYRLLVKNRSIEEVRKARWASIADTNLDNVRHEIDKLIKGAEEVQNGDSGDGSGQTTSSVASS